MPVTIIPGTISLVSLTMASSAVFYPGPSCRARCRSFQCSSISSPRCHRKVRHGRKNSPPLSTPSHSGPCTIVCRGSLSKVIVPDKWKEGAHNTTEGGGRKVNENKLLSKKHRWTPYGQTKCIICKQQVHQDGKYCHTCAYSKGVCAMCGKQVIDTKCYKQSNV